MGDGNEGSARGRASVLKSAQVKQPDQGSGGFLCSFQGVEVGLPSAARMEVVHPLRVRL
jgi:hypothetical protein